jgi:serine protease Do
MQKFWLILLVPVTLAVWLVLSREPLTPPFKPRPIAEVETLMQGAFVAARPAMVQVQSLAVSSDERFVYSRQGRASGFVFTPDGYALTAYHAVVGMDRLEVLTTKQELLPARVVGFDESRDLAVLKISAPRKLEAIKLEFATEPKINDPLVEIGNSGNDFIQPRYGQVQGFLQNQELLIPTRLMLSNVEIAPGDSGGAVLGFSGNAIGLGIGYAKDAFGRVSYLVPLFGLEPWIEKMKSGARLLLPSLGFRVSQDEQQGLVVEYIQPNSPAAQAGFKLEPRQPMRLLALNDTPLETLRDYNRIVRSKKIGDALKVRLTVGGSARTVQLRFE